MLALGRARTVTLLNVLGGAVMLGSMPWLLPRFGLEGMGAARLLYGPFTLIIYLPLFTIIRRNSRRLIQVNATTCEEV